MRIKMGYVETKRELFFRGTGDENCVIELLNGKTMYSIIKKNSKEYKVDCQSTMLFSSDILLSDSCKDEFFFIHPYKNKIISRIEDYSDLWYSLNMGKIKKRTLPLVERCLKILNKSGFSDENLVYFMKKDDGFYYLMVDGEEYGYLDNSNSDADFKNMLSYVFKDVGFSAEVVVLPSKGENLLFSSTVAIYKERKDFEEACKSKKLFPVSININVKDIDELVAVDRE